MERVRDGTSFRRCRTVAQSPQVWLPCWLRNSPAALLMARLLFAAVESAKDTFQLLKLLPGFGEFAFSG